MLAVSSGGGHWMQLQRLLPALDGCEVEFVTVHQRYAEAAAPHAVHLVRDATRWNKLSLVILALQMLAIVIARRPDVVISTGAAPGLLAVCYGKLLGARTLWLDSLANSEEISMSGRLARRYTDLHLTQWPHLQRTHGTQYRGSVL